MSRYHYYDGDTFKRNGRTFKIEMPYDDCGRVPWEDDDGAGIVSEWTRRDKAPGERELCSARGNKRFYDWQETTVKAKRDGWGLCDDDLAALESRLGRKPTRKQIVAEAVARDFDRMRAWCNDQWHYVGVVVTEIESGETESLWGIENDCHDYLRDVAHDRADEINERLDDEMSREIAASRPDISPSED